jgi:hypothetical protein
MHAVRPEIGAWYQTAEGSYLEVVAFDPDDGSVEVQHFDGAVEEYDADSWTLLTLSPASPPEDWSGSLDLGRDDYGVDLDRPAGAVRSNPLDFIEPDNDDLDFD